MNAFAWAVLAAFLAASTVAAWVNRPRRHHPDGAAVQDPAPTFGLDTWDF